MRINPKSIGWSVLALFLCAMGFLFLVLGSIDHFVAAGLCLICFGFFWIVYGKAWTSLQPYPQSASDALPVFVATAREEEFGTVFKRLELLNGAAAEEHDVTSR